MSAEVPDRKSTDRDSFAATASAKSIEAWAGSIPITRIPVRASLRAKTPVPHPRSMTVPAPSSAAIAS
ncbi:Uncharacterised protein [Mycobacteroides abscessus subsp. abscessus]|nr:Uncharacterised protein [Mycobacteroides abscessus subsp. abscessus]